MLALFLRRQRNILDYALGSLWRNNLKNGGVLLVFCLVIFMVASFRLVVSGLDRAAGQLLDAVPDITVQQMTAGRQVVFNAEHMTELKQIFGISAVRPRVWGYYFDESNGANYTVIGDSGDGSGTWSIPGFGVLFDDESTFKIGEGDVLIGQLVKNSMELTGRRSFSLFRPDLSMKSFQTVGSFTAETSLVTDDLIVARLEDARDLFGMAENELTDVLISVTNPAEIDTIAAKISERIHGTRVITKQQIAKTYRVAFGWRSGFGLACLFGSVAAFIILAWDKASGLSPEQLREVGVLKAVGWQTNDIMTLRFWESIAVSLLAFCFGYGLAWVHVLWFDGLLYRPILLGWSVLRPTVSLVPVFSVTDVLLVFSLSVLPYLTATIIPAWRSALVRPDSVI